MERRSAKFGSVIAVDISLDSVEMKSRFLLDVLGDSERVAAPSAAQSMLDALFVFCRRCTGRMFAPDLSSTKLVTETDGNVRNRRIENFIAHQPVTLTLKCLSILPE